MIMPEHVSDEELKEWADKRADDAGRLARELIGYRASKRIDSASDERTVNNTMRHEYRVLTEQEKTAMTILKDSGLNFLRLVDDWVPKGREAALAKTKIEEAVMWAVKGLTA